MNVPDRNFSAIRLGATDRLEVPRSTGKWPISYRFVELVSVGFDAIVILLSCIVSGVLYHSLEEGRAGDLSEYLGTAAVVAALFCGLVQIRGLYSPAELLNGAQVRQIIIIWAGVILFLTGVVFALKIGKEFSRGAALSFASLGLALLILQRVFWRNLLRYGVAESKFAGRDIVLITAGGQGADRAISGVIHGLGFHVRSHFSLPDSERGSKFWNEAISEILTYVRGSDIQEIVLGADPGDWLAICDIIARLRVLPLPVSLIPIGAAADLFRRPSHLIGGNVCIELHRGPLSGFERATKRILDILGAITGLLLLMPLMFVAAAAIKLDSPGPILFRQRRCGFNGKPFQIYKFRTMSVMEDSELVRQAARSDNRITPVGRWLRRTSIDELPQLVNVLNGTMSLVGPRPHALAHDNQFDKVVSKYAFRHHVKPGVTGWAQVNGYRGETPTVASIQQRVEHDLWYIDNWSFGLDFVIVLRTVFEVMRSRNAY